MIITVAMKLKLRDCDRIFKEGFGPGVLAIQEVDTDIGDGPRDFWFGVNLMRQEDEFIARHIEVEMEEKH